MRALLVVGLVLCAASVSAGTGERRLVSFGLQRGPAVPEEVFRTLDDAYRAQLEQAASERGFKLQRLSRVAGLEEQAKACKAAACRAAISARLAASHTLRGAVERHQAGYALSLFLEQADDGAFTGGERMAGSVPVLVGKLRAGVDGLLEDLSPKDGVARGRLAKTARAYLEKGRTDDAVRTLERAIALSPFHPEAARLTLEKLRLLDGDPEGGAAAFAATLEALELYGPRSVWALTGIGGESAQRTVHVALRQRLVQLGTQRQKEAAALKGEAKAERLLLAERAYGAFLDEFPDEEEAAEMELYLAECEYERGAFVDAAGHYAAVAEREAAPAALRRQAASSAVHARERELEEATRRGELSALDLGGALVAPAEPVELSAEETAFIEAIDRLASAFDDEADAAAFAYRAAQIHVLRGHEAEGRRRLAEVASRWPKSKAGRTAKAALRAKPALKD